MSSIASRCRDRRAIGRLPGLISRLRRRDVLVRAARPEDAPRGVSIACNACRT